MSLRHPQQDWQRGAGRGRLPPVKSACGMGVASGHPALDDLKQACGMGCGTQVHRHRDLAPCNSRSEESRGLRPISKSQFDPLRALSLEASKGLKSRLGLEPFLGRQIRFRGVVSRRLRLTLRMTFATLRCVALLLAAPLSALAFAPAVAVLASSRRLASLRPHPTYFLCSDRPRDATPGGKDGAATETLKREFSDVVRFQPRCFLKHSRLATPSSLVF